MEVLMKKGEIIYPKDSESLGGALVRNHSERCDSCDEESKYDLVHQGETTLKIYIPVCNHETGAYIRIVTSQPKKPSRR